MTNRDGFVSLAWRCGQWCIAPNGIPQFDAKKDRPEPRPAVFLENYGGYLRFLGRSTKANDSAYKLEHQPHRGRCNYGGNCWIDEPGYVSTNPRDYWTPLAILVNEYITCFEPDEEFVEQLFDIKSRH